MKLPIREEDSKKYIVGFSFGNRSIIWASCLYKEDGGIGRKKVFIVTGLSFVSSLSWVADPCDLLFSETTYAEAKPILTGFSWDER